MFESFWARQARVRVGLVKNVYKTNKILTILQTHCSRTGRPHRTFQKAYKTKKQIDGFDPALEDRRRSSLAGGNTYIEALKIVFASFKIESLKIDLGLPSCI